jgi:stearoyl-CoA desaturase (delta-9 desaturase)
MTTSTTTRPESAGIAWPALIWIGILHVGALLAFVPAYFSWQAVLLCLVLHWVTGGLGITLTYHRLLTHRSFEVRPKWLEYVLTAIGCSASEGGPIGWVADHRAHHAHSDDPEDVHSPNRGFAWAHMLWWMTPDVTSLHTEDFLKKWAPDLMKDPVHRWLDKYFIVFPIAGAVALYAIGGMPYLVWGFFVRSVLVLHATWLVNSATHVWGYRSHETRDTSTNLWWVAIVTYGEGWHNNHHAFQTSARHGLRWWEVDVTYLTIRLMSWVGMARNIKMPKLTHAAPIVSRKEAARLSAKKAKKVKAGRRLDDEPELVGTSA